MKFSFSPGIKILGGRPIAANFLEKKTEFYIFQASGFDQPNSQIGLGSRIVLEISISEISGLVGKTVVDELNGLTEVVAHITDLFERGYQGDLESGRR